LAPTESRLWYVKGLATYQLGQLDQAIKYFRIAIEQESTAPAPHLALIYLLMTTHQGDNLQAYIESLLAQGWDQADLHDYYACLMQRQGHLQVAHDHLQRAIQVDPRPASRWLRLGMVLAQLRDYTAAHDALREALKRRADDANGWLALGMVLRQLSANEAAIDAFNKALALTPNHPLAFFHQACCYGALQRPDWAIEHLRRAIALDPARYLPRSQREPVLQGLEARSLMAS